MDKIMRCSLHMPISYKVRVIVYGSKMQRTPTPRPHANALPPLPHANPALLPLYTHQASTGSRADCHRHTRSSNSSLTHTTRQTHTSGPRHLCSRQLCALHRRRGVRRVHAAGLPCVRLGSGGERLDRVRILGRYALGQTRLGALRVAVGPAAGGRR